MITPKTNVSLHILAKLIILLGTITPACVVGAVFLYLLLVPCDLANLGYMYIPVCNSNIPYNEYNLAYYSGTFLSIASPFILAWVLLHTFGYCALEYTMFTMLYCYSLINYFGLYFKLYLSNDTDQYSKCINMFKEIQMLTHRYNSIHRGPLTISCITLCSYVFIISFYAVCAMSQQLIFPQLFLFSSLAFDTILIVLMIDGAFKGGVIIASKQVLCSVRKRSTGSLVLNRHLKLQHKYIKSWQVLKIYSGSVNYYEEKTALILLDFNINQVVSLLLL